MIGARRYERASDTRCTRCGHQSEPVPTHAFEDRVRYRCPNCYNRGSRRRLWSEDEPIEWENNPNPLESGIPSVLDDVRVTAGKSSAGVWFRLDGDPSVVLDLIHDESVRDYIRSILADHLE